MPSPIKRLFLTVVVVALTSSCSSRQFERRVEASTRPAQVEQKSTAVAAVVKAPKANLRDAPSSSAKIVTTLDKDELLSLLTSAPVGPWYQVRDSRTGSEGWIHGNAIALLQTAEPVSASTPQVRKRTTSPPVTGKTYVNVDGIRVRSPVFTDTKPERA
jgi:uncharacterized protein YgiM (DUF1202 family)